LAHGISAIWDIEKIYCVVKQNILKMLQGLELVANNCICEISAVGNSVFVGQWAEGWMVLCMAYITAHCKQKKIKFEPKIILL
jgi:hypothetical protein